MNFLKKLFSGKPQIKKTDLTKRFDLIGRVGQGSMSKVWRARDTSTGKMVALKVLDGEKTRKFEARFPGIEKPTEGEIAVQLRHPGIVHTYEHGLTKDNLQFLVMEFIEGVGLSFLVDSQNEVMQTHRLSLVVQLGQAIQYFHEQNWIHRDICPRNIMVDNSHCVKLMDFGLVVPNTAEFQKPGNRTGTANYMAPELIKRQKTDQRIDLFSYAVTCYEMYTGRLPWESAATLEAVLQHINSPPDDIREHAPGIDDQVASTIMRGLAVNPADRWPTAARMVEQFVAAQRRLENPQAT